MVPVLFSVCLEITVTCCIEVGCASRVEAAACAPRVEAAACALRVEAAACAPRVEAAACALVRLRLLDL